MDQKNLWQDGYTTLIDTETGAIGKTRLRRFLNWLDRVGLDWTEPDLDAYAVYLREERQLYQGTIYHTLAELRRHYILVLSNPDNYSYIDPREHVRFVNNTLRHLGYNTATINFESITRDPERIGSENLAVILPDPTHLARNTVLKNFVYWLDETGRHWSYPDLLHYKLLLNNDETASSDHVKNSLTCIRRRYFEIAEDKSVLAQLKPKERKAFLHDLRKRLAYMDEYPSKLEPTREMLENDPYNCNLLTSAQIKMLLAQPDTNTLAGLRDRALIALVLATGIQQVDIAKLQYDDIFQQYDDKPALYVHPTKLRAARYIPYDDYTIAYEWVIEFMRAGSINEGDVFRGLSGSNALRATGIAPDTIGDILSRYPIEMNGSLLPLLFSDLRATAGRRWYDNGVALAEIERRLGLMHRPSVLNLIGLRLRPEFN